MISFALTGTFDLTDLKSDIQVQSVVHRGNYAFVTCSSGSGAGLFAVFDITDRANPVLLDSLGLGENAYGCVISDDANTAYIYGQFATIYKLDITDKSAIFLDTSASPGGGFDISNLGMEARSSCIQFFENDGGRLAILARDSDGVSYVIPIRPSDLFVEDAIITADGVTDNIISMWIDVDNSVLYTGHSNTGTATVVATDLSAYPSVSQITVIEPGIVNSQITNIVTNDTVLVFILSNLANDKFLYTYDITNRFIITLLGSIQTEMTSGDDMGQLAEAGSGILSADYPDTLRAFNISDPTAVVQDASNSGFQCRSVSYDPAVGDTFCAAGATDDGIFHKLFVFSIAGVAGPVITDISPARGGPPGGTTVTLTGTGFVQGATSVTIGGTEIAAGDVTVSDDETSLTFVTPAHALGAVDVTVTTDGGTSNSVEFTYALGSGFLEKSDL